HINLHSYDPTQKPDEEFIYVDIDSVEKGTGKIDFSQKLLGKNAPSRARRLAFKNNIVISTVRPYLKGFTFIEKDLTNCVFSTGFAILESKDENILLNKALYFAFMYLSDLMKQMEATMGKAAYPSINKSDIENYKIPIPPLEIQSTLVSEIEKLELQIAENQKIIESVKAEKEAVLKRYL
ncbi:MAG: restriction endonuclease subunit S, partial [Thermoflexibacteraceae bacterium]